jgi:dihydroneopterin aldolase
LYDEERLLGNNFVVNCKVGIARDAVHVLEESIDYEKILHIIQYRMLLPKPLLETVAFDVEADLKLNFPFISYFFFSIKKKNPQLGMRIDSSEIVIEHDGWN